MNCAVCGKGFADKRGKLYCSQECKYKARMVRERKLQGIQIKTCKTCGEPFEARHGRQDFCCKQCRNRYFYRLYRNEKPKKEKALPTQDRPYTKDTVMLVSKWYQEGMSIRELAELLDRPLSSIERALEMGGVA